MKTSLVLIGACLGLNLWASDATVPPTPSPNVLVIVGAPGEPDYKESFEKSAAQWAKACSTAGAHLTTIGLTPPDGTNDLDLVQHAIETEIKTAPGDVWIVLIGHGTFDGKEGKFNLRGPDLSATQLAEWLQSVPAPLAVINSASASGPFLNKLSKTGRVVITATRSGYEQNFARFGQFFASAISEVGADLDKDGQVSLLEAYLWTANHVAEFYRTQGRLATEHPLLDDNGDGLGTPPDWFRGVRAVKKANEGASLDGLRAHQFHLLRSETEKNLSPSLRTRRNELEVAIEQLRAGKETLGTDQYYAQLETLLLELARVYDTGDREARKTPSPEAERR